MQPAPQSSQIKVATKPKLGNSDFFLASAPQSRDSLLDVLQTNMEALGDETVADLLVHDDTDCAGGYVPNTAGTSVVELVGHT